LRSAFPGGSITGAPKIRAMEIIDELEPNRRSAYCGSIGYICASGNMDSNIAIRTLVCQDQKIYCWAGGGLVADSTVESEYQETYDKVNKILPVLTELENQRIK
ncbi:MAG: chorismate-binding protein, partial [Psychrosphaera sp.]|nr:chorismate-binding protein [Psychrosphaera sp.]